MFKNIALIATVFATGLSSLLSAASPKGPQSGALDQASLIQAVEIENTTTQARKREAVAPVAPDAVMPFLDGGDDTKFTLLRFEAKNSEAVRLHIEDMHLSEGMTLFVYGLDQNGQAVDIQGPLEGAGPGHDGSVWTAAIRARQIVVELQIGGEIPADLPFRVTEVEEASADGALAAAVEPAPKTTEVRTGNYRGVDLTYEVKDGLAIFEGDIILGEAGEIEPAQGKNRNREAIAITGASYRWPGGVVPYAIDPNLPNQYRVTDAINYWNTTMAGVIRFIPRTNETAYVYFPNQTSNTCSSAVGRRGTAQTLNVGPYCSTGNVIHELGHAVGLWHEQSREDRNSFVIINWENITSGQSHNFNQHITDGDDIGLYDFDSIMHYPAYGFSANGLPTITTIPAGIPIGQRSYLSAKDQAGVRLMYPSTTTTTTTTTTTSSVTVTFASNPTGQALVVDGVSRVAPFSLTFTAGTLHSISAPSTSGTGWKSTFASWSDGGAQSHNITAPSGNSTITANFQKLYTVNARSASLALGTVSMSPVSADTYYPNNSTLSLTATPAAGSCFLGWSGLVAGAPSSTSLVVTGPYDITANFGTGAVTLNTSGVYFPNFKKQSATISVSATTGCGWSARSNASWLNVTQSTTTGSGTVTVTTQPNQGPTRTTTVSIGNLTLTVTQAGR